MVSPQFIAEFNGACATLRLQPQDVVFEYLMHIVNKHRQYIAADEESNFREVQEVARKVSEGVSYSLKL